MSINLLLAFSEVARLQTFNDDRFGAYPIWMVNYFFLTLLLEVVAREVVVVVFEINTYVEARTVV